jgi:polysaccharide biosynthesis protein PelD
LTKSDQRDEAERIEARSSVLPVLPPRNAVLEILVLLVPVILLEWQVAGFPDLTTYQPHPYWFPVLLVSLQYGTVSGLLAAAVATIGVVLIGLPDTEIDENHFAYLFRVWIQPGLWVLAALLLGQFRMRQIERKAELTRSVERLTRQNQELASFSTKLRDHYGTLERKFAATSAVPVDDLLDALAVFANVKPGGLASAFGECMRAAFPESQASLHAIEGGALRCVATSGWAPEARWRKDFSAGDPLFVSVIGNAARLSVLNAADEAVLAGEGLAAVPILAPGTGLVAGMLKVENISPPALDPRLVRRLAVIADHLAIPVAALMQTQGDGKFAVTPRGGEAVAHLRPWQQRLWRKSGQAVPGARPGTRR